MFPFWETVVAPVLEHSGARTIVEIGALRGENTELMINRLGADVVLHIIDPLPEFDPTVHERRFGGRYVFHRDLSLNVLPNLGPMDAAIIDGDHNWYTVLNECRQLAEVARGAGHPLPLLIFHDVGWPYGRRDLYYDPSQIPEEFRQPYERRGIRRGTEQLVPAGGMNRQLANAVREGGPRNGVMTAIDDFIAEHDRPLRSVVLPLYFGLAIVVEQAVLDEGPELAAFLDRLESADGLRELIELGEGIRTDEATWNQLVFSHHTSRIDQLTANYLDLLRNAVLGDLGTENELRVSYLEESLRLGRPLDPEILRDPVRGMQGATQRLEAVARTGAHADDTGARVWFRPTSMGRHRLEHLESQLDDLRRSGTQGDLVECGVGRGGSATFLRGYLEAHGMKEPTVWLVDPLQGDGGARVTDGRFNGEARGFPALTADLNIVRETMHRHGLLDERVRFAQGPFAAALTEAPIERIALLRVGSGARHEIGPILDAARTRLVPGARIVVEDAGDGMAVERFRAEYGHTAPLERVDEIGVAWTVGPGADPPTPTVAAVESAVQASSHPPLPASEASDGIELSIVVVFYNMRREAARTLHSLSRAYQTGIEDRCFEVIVVDNGSAEEERLDASWVESFGPEFRLIDLGADAPPSPTVALNIGMREARGELIGFMVDGAHVVSPGVFQSAFKAQAAYGPSAVAIQQWYVGPGQQSAAMLEGYDPETEDRLFDSIEWPIDGYRLFDISSFIGDRDWFDGVPESNCLIVPRSALHRVGGFDDAFDEPGGSFSNLDFFDRVSADPLVDLVTVLGEGSFHQVHDGTTTNQPSTDERFARITAYVEKYEALRGKPYKGPRRPIHYIGSLRGGAKRTKARRRTAEAFLRAGRAGAEGGPTEAFPMPADTKAEFTEAYWQTLNWEKVTWLGRSMRRPATDLVTYQEIIHRVRPDWIIDVSTDDGGRAFFLASICELIGHGQVVTIDGRADETRPTHDRLHQVVGPATDEDVVARVRALVAGGSALVVLGSRGRPPRLLGEFAAYRDLVPIGSYVIVEMTAVNGHPIWPEYGAGPFEAVVRITNEDRDFIIDSEPEIHGMTFNPGGFLRRVR